MISPATNFGLVTEGPPVMPAVNDGNRFRSAISGAGRGVALFFGLFSLLNVLGDWRHPGFDATLWWIDVRWIDPPVRQGLALATSALLLRFAVAPRMGQLLHAVFLAVLLLLTVACAANVVTFWRLLLSGSIRSACPVPLSLLLIAFLVLIAWAARISIGISDSQRSRWVWIILTSCGCSVLFPLGQMLCFGCTDYRRPADVIVVFGCRVFREGTPSHALRDRVRTAAELYRSGLARRVLLSGGPGDGPIHETEAMRRLAIKYGVAAEDILIDDAGLNTEATVRNVLSRTSPERFNRILAVSHFYHLPRIKLCFHRNGSEVFTVPAQEEYLLRGLTKFMAREIVALQWYYLVPLFDWAKA